MKKLIWWFDLAIYGLFRWRWNKRFVRNTELRKRFLSFLNAWEALNREPAMGIGLNPPAMPNTKEVKDEY